MTHPVTDYLSLNIRVLKEKRRITRISAKTVWSSRG